MEKCQKISIEMETFIAELMAKTVIEERDRDRGYVVKQPRLIPETYVYHRDLAHTIPISVQLSFFISLFLLQTFFFFFSYFD